MKGSNFWDRIETVLGGNQMMRALKESLAAVLVDLSNSSIVGVTPLACQLFGYPEQELIGVHLERLIPEQYRHQHLDFVAEYEQHPRSARMGDRRLPGLREDGTVFTSSIWLVPAPDGCVLAVFFE
ncbi:MAG: PAS domain-containing protein [Planctomycetaceae bacterium]